MRRRDFIFTIACTSLVPAGLRAAVGESEWLITPAEFEREVRERSVMTPRGRTVEEEYWSVAPKAGPGSPQIVVRSPDVEKVIAGPVDLDVEFIPAEGATIDLSTFSVRYGILGIDVTERVRRYAELSESGIKAALSDLPKGAHSFELRIADNLNREARQRIRCKIAG